MLLGLVCCLMSSNATSDWIGDSIFVIVSTPTESLKLAETFVAWMDNKSSLRQLCDEGKGKLQWERDIPQDALDNLVGLANADFKKNLGKIIHDIYLTGHNLFKDMPQGDHKKRAKYRFASKTLMRILPAELKGKKHAFKWYAPFALNTSWFWDKKKFPPQPRFCLKNGKETKKKY